MQRLPETLRTDPQPSAPLLEYVTCANSSVPQDGPFQTELFLVSGIFTVLAIRGYLWMMSYPKIGGAGLHIAHMLWGGLGMMFSILLTSSFLGRRIQRVAALVGGVGFGCFIDELGKFITVTLSRIVKTPMEALLERGSCLRLAYLATSVSCQWLQEDNNYFFQPTVMLIYILFIAIYSWYSARLPGCHHTNPFNLTTTHQVYQYPATV